MNEQLIKVGCIDAEIYSCITERITTSEVIITRERIAHIAERHPGDYERLIGDVSEALSEPDYILEANRPHTGIVLKELERNGEKIKLVLRVRVDSDPLEYKNSVLSFWHVGDTTWKKNLRNKKILYRRKQR